MTYDPILETTLLRNIISMLNSQNSVNTKYISSMFYFLISIIILTVLTIINGEPVHRQPQLKSMHVESHIRNRYARTVVSSKYLNPDNRSQYTTFSIVLPDTAFISGFVMEIKGTKYEAYVREKEEAKREYQQAVNQGRSAGHVAISVRDSNKFTVSVNVEPLSKVTFNLTYEELLVRKHGKYEMVINLHPGQLVKELDVKIYLNETSRITDVKTPALRSGNEITDLDNEPTNQFATIKSMDNDNMTLEIQFTADRDQQKEIMKAFEKRRPKAGIVGQFVLQYDVEREPQGEVLIDDGYFVHFFTPSGLQPIPKYVVFVLDVSGSMGGKKLQQLRKAMRYILNELNEGDYFNLVKFHSSVQVQNETNSWLKIKYPGNSPLPRAKFVNKENIDKAQSIVEQITHGTLTNVYSALLVALRLARNGVSNLKETQHTPQPIIIFLTDGEANVGKSDPSTIIDMVESENKGAQKAAIFTLAFGNDANRDFLKKLALKNSGFMRQIYEAADASLQLQDFYKQISSPLLTNVTFKYATDQVKSLTRHNFDLFFKGSEMVVAGRADNSFDNFVTVQGATFNDSWDFIPIIKRRELSKEYGSLERLWAYLTIKQLLDRRFEYSDVNATDAVDASNKEALKLALQYSFVTPFSSLVIVKPNESESIAVQNEGESEVYDTDKQYILYPHAVPPSLVYHSSQDLGGSMVMEQTNNENDYQMFVDEAPITTKVKTVTNTTQHLITELPWLSGIITKSETIIVHNRTYLIDKPRGSTAKERTLCHVKYLNRNGTCTLLAECRRVHPKIASLDMYNQFFCSLDSERYAGVCCVNVF